MRGNDEIADKLRQVGLRITHHRQVLLSTLHSLNGHATADSLRASATGPQIPLPTVYAVLGDLVRAGLVKEVRGEDGVLRFDANVARHHHLSCVRYSSPRIRDSCASNPNDQVACMSRHVLLYFQLGGYA